MTFWHSGSNYYSCGICEFIHKDSQMRQNTKISVIYVLLYDYLQMSNKIDLFKKCLGCLEDKIFSRE